MHFHHLTGVQDTGLRTSEIIPDAAFLKNFLIADQNDLFDLGMDPKRVPGADHIDIGGIVPAHGIECDNHCLWK